MSYQNVFPIENDFFNPARFPCKKNIDYVFPPLFFTFHVRI